MSQPSIAIAAEADPTPLRAILRDTRDPLVFRVLMRMGPRFDQAVALSDDEAQRFLAAMEGCGVSFQTTLPLPGVEANTQLTQEERDMSARRS